MKNKEALEKEIKELKKYELHCHLDGSISPKMIRILAEKAKITLPEGEELLKLLKVEMNCKSLKEYLEKFDLPLACLISADSFRLSTFDILENAASENVEYMEIRFAPLLSEGPELSAEAMIEGALDGMNEARSQFGIESNLILCGMRHMDVQENFRVVELAKRYYGCGVAAIDIAGDEAGYSITKQKDMLNMAEYNNIPITIHAGECGSAQSMWDAISLGASRLGHGIAAIQDRALMKYCAEHKIAFEMCPTSNFQTKAAGSISEYPVLSFLEDRIPITINTDNRTVSNTTLTEEYLFLCEHYGLTIRDVKEIIENAQMAAFRK